MKKRLKQMITCALAIPLLATALFPGFAAASSKTVHKQPMVAEGELIVRYKKPHGNKLKSLAQSSAYQTQGVDSRTVLVKTDRAKLELATRNLAADPDVEYVEPNYVYHSSEQQSAPVDDPLYDQLWGLEAVGAPEAWELLRGWSGEKKAEVVVAVVDTGVDANHPDLAGKVLPYGYNTIANNTNAQDDYGHGTHVAGTIAAVTDNGTGVAGIAGKENIRILPIKVLDDTGYGTALQISQGVDKAVELGADIINMSLGGFGRSKLLEEAIHKATEKGVLVVVAAGNETDDAYGYAPAAYSDVVTVASINEERSPSWFSNYGSPIDISAPGEAIMSTVPGGGYEKHDGTSMATPHVAGAAALVKLTHPDWGPEEIRAALEQTAMDMGDNGRDDETGHGLLQMGQALAFDGQPTIRVVTPSPNSDIWGTFTLEAHVTNKSVASIRITTEKGKELAVLPVHNGKATGQLDSSLLGNGKKTLLLQPVRSDGGSVEKAERLTVVVHKETDSGVRITVTDANGKPAQGSQVVLYRLDEEQQAYQFVANTYANEQGIGYLPRSVQLPDEQYVVVASYYDWDKEDPYSFFQQFSEWKDQKELHLSFGNTRELAVNVSHDGNSLPLADTSLIFAPQVTGDRSLLVNLFFRPDEQGQLRVHVPPGTYTVYAHRNAAKGENYFLTETVTIDAQTSKLEFDLNKAVPVRFQMPAGAKDGNWLSEGFFYDTGIQFGRNKPFYVTASDEYGRYNLTFTLPQGKERYFVQLSAATPFDWSQPINESLLPKPWVEAYGLDDGEFGDLSDINVKPGQSLRTNYAIHYNKQFELIWLYQMEQPSSQQAEAAKSTESGQMLVRRIAEQDGLEPVENGIQPTVVLTNEAGEEVWTEQLHESSSFNVPDDYSIVNGAYDVSLDFSTFPLKLKQQRIHLGTIHIQRDSDEVDVTYVDPEKQGLKLALLEAIDPQSGDVIAKAELYNDFFDEEEDPGTTADSFTLKGLSVGSSYQFRLSAVTGDGTALFSQRTIQVPGKAFRIDLSRKKDRPTRVQVNENEAILGMKLDEYTLPLASYNGSRGMWAEPGTYDIQLLKLQDGKMVFFTEKVKVEGAEQLLDVEPDLSRLHKFTIDMPSNRDQYSIGFELHQSDFFGSMFTHVMFLGEGDTEMYVQDKDLPFTINRYIKGKDSSMVSTWEPQRKKAKDGYLIRFDNKPPQASLQTDKTDYRPDEELDVTVNVVDRNGNRLVGLVSVAEDWVDSLSSQVMLASDKKGKTALAMYDKKKAAYVQIPTQELYPRIELTKEGEKIESLKNRVNWMQYQYRFPEEAETGTYELTWSLAYPYGWKEKLSIELHKQE